MAPVVSSLLTKFKVACRCEQPLAESTIAKLALHCQVELDQILVVRDMPTVYQVPLLLEEQKIIPLLRTRLNLDALTVAPASVSSGAELWDTWKFVVTQDHEATIDIALVGKYVETHDAYLSVVKSLEHSSMHLRRKLNLIWVDAEHLEPKAKSTDEEKYNEAWQAVRTASGVIVPGGFGTRGTEGMMLASKFARENGTPFLGVRCQKTTPCAHMTNLFCRFAWASRLLPSSTHETSVVWQRPTRKSSTPWRRTVSSFRCPSSTSKTWEAPCVLGPGRRSSRREARGQRSVLYMAAGWKSRRDIVTGTKSIPRTSTDWRPLVCILSERTRQASAWRSSN